MQRISGQQLSMLLVVSGIVLSFLTPIAAILITHRGISDLLFENRFIKKSTVDETLVPNTFECLQMCNKNDHCNSYQYRKDTKHCRMFSEEYYSLSAVSTQTEPGWKYFHIYEDKGIQPWNLAAKCPVSNGFHLDVNKNLCLLYVPNVLTHSDSTDICHQRNASSLVRIDTALKGYRVREYLATVSSGSVDVFIQGTRYPNSSSFLFDDGTALTYSNWCPGEPNGQGNMPIFLRISAQGGCWKDVGDIVYPLYATLCEVM